MEVGKFRQYMVKMDGSGRLAQRNRRHLQKIKQPCADVPHIPLNTPQTTTPTLVVPENPEGHIVTTPLQTDNDGATQHNDQLVNTQHFLRRSQRFTRQPDRYTDERCRK